MISPPDRNKPRRPSSGRLSTIPNEDLFISTGRLTVRVLSVSDPYDITPFSSRKASILSRLRGTREDMYAYAKLGIVTQDDTLVNKLYTTVATICPRDSTVLDMPLEQGTAFEDVLSEHHLRILFVLTPGISEASSEMYALDSYAALVPSVASTMGACVAYTSIPLQRLESGRRVVQ